MEPKSLHVVRHRLPSRGIQELDVSSSSSSMSRDRDLGSHVATLLLTAAKGIFFGSIFYLFLYFLLG